MDKKSVLGMQRPPGAGLARGGPPKAQWRAPFLSAARAGRRFLLLIPALCSLPRLAGAACTGSGLAFNCSAGTSASEVQSALNSASDGATLTFAAGSYAWSTPISLNNIDGVTLICAAPLACAVNANVLWQWANWGTTDKLYRISGFDFINPGSYFIWLYGTGSSAATLTRLRFDHNRLTRSTDGSDIITFGEASGSKTRIEGVMDHNTFRTTSGHSRWIVGYVQTAAAWPASPMGTARNLFIEDNTFSDQCLTNSGNAAVDIDGGPLSFVIRFNHFTNARIEHHGYYWSFPGPASSEVYGNSLTMTCGADVMGGSYAIKHQGAGEWIVFNNTVTPSSGKGFPHILQNYRSFYDSANLCDGTRAEDGNRPPLAANRGYPCNRQPGRDGSGALKPHYYWNNQWNDGSAISLTLSCPDQGIPNYCANHIQANRDYYQGKAAAQSSPTSPFDGSSGVGFGTLANRPTTCTTNVAEAGGGVGYFATDTNTLYRCASANTWVVHYKPYAYPHPLVLGGGAPAAPCDVNGNGATDVTDVQLAVNQALGVASCTADLNKDGQCNVIDVQRVVNAVLSGVCQ